MLIKCLLLIKRIFFKKFHSCVYICSGINFYPNNIVKACCFTVSDDVNLCKIDEKNNADYKEINKNRKKLFKELKQGNIPLCCKSCPNLKMRNWKFSKIITLITLNYFMFCNLKCTHCGYLKNVRYKTSDTKDNLVFDKIKYFEKKSILAKDYIVDIGGGEPSLNNNLDNFIDYLVSKGHRIHINSNVAKFKENYINGIKMGLIFLTLTPDAGSREVYNNIKGVDYFDIMRENLKKYMELASEEVEVKFILEAGNICDIDSMIKLCLDCGVKNVALSMDLNIKKDEYSFYKPYFLKFTNLCNENNLKLIYKLIPDELLR